MKKKPGKKPQPPEKLFWSHIMTEPNCGCWLWTATVKPGGVGSGGGYSHFQHISPITGARGHYGHRFSYEFYKGRIPDGCEIDHICRVRCCVNPLHLEAVTRYENQRRGEKTFVATHAVKTHCIHGHPFDEKNTWHARPTEKKWRVCKRCHADREQARRMAGKVRGRRDASGVMVG